MARQDLPSTDASANTSTGPGTGPSTDPAASAGAATGDDLGDRAQTWAATMGGHDGPGPVRLAHRQRGRSLARREVVDRLAREAAEEAHLHPAATRARGAGRRAVSEEPDPVRTCFERDRDRILHASAFRRLAGKTQVFVMPADHQRTRLTHALEVAQVATGIARALGLNVALTEAIALAHDCGHGPGGHASEDALSPYVEGGYDHAVWGADVTLRELNLCEETLDGVRNHSWSRPTPATAEGEVVSWADRIAYVCHDFEDAVHAGIVTEAMLPPLVARRGGRSRREQLAAFIDGVLEGTRQAGCLAMTEALAEALSAFRSFNYEHIYLRRASRRQAERVGAVLQALVERFADRPNLLPRSFVERERCDVAAGSPAAYQLAVAYVGGMTDRFAFRAAVSELGWRPEQLPAGIDL